MLIFLFSMVATHAQTTGGTNFWLTFGQNYNFPASSVDLQIRVVCRDLPAFGVIYFTEIDDVVSFDVDPGEVYTYTLTDPQKVAVYNNSGTSTNNKSIHITSNQPITVYALNQTSASADATNILPLTALGTYYYQISYSPFSNVSDAYAIVVTENNTEISHGTTSLGTFNAGEVYYRTSNTDMTGTRITSNKPVAFFALNQSAIIPNDCDAADCLMQQLAPVHTWGKNFFVPVSQFPRDRVRIVASQNNTKLTLTGGVVVSGNPNNMQAGQFVELDVYYNNNGCYIQADKPVGVCTYLTGSMCNPPPYSSDPAQAWLPSIEQTASESIISPFIPNGSSALSKHYALVIAPTEMKDNTRVSIGMAAPVALAGVIWRDNAAAGMSFCTYEMTNPVVSYRFTNPQEILVMGYGTGASESYYYLGYSSMRDLSAAFYANAVHYQDMPHQLFCEHNINFTTEFAEIESLSSLNWVIDGMPQTHLDNLHTWSRNFSAGVYIVKMNITYEDESKRSYESILRVGGLVTASADPPEWGTVTGSGCYHAGTTAVVTATPISSDYIFINWTDETGAEVSTNNIHSFIVTNDNTLVAHFEMLTYPVVLLKNPDTGGIVDGGGPAMLPGQVITVMATPSINYVFVNWTEDTPNGAVASTDASFTFAVTGPRTLVANFTPKTFDVNVSVDFPASGTVCCNGTNIAYGTYYTVSVTPNPHFFFEYWSEGDNIPVSSSPEYTFLVERSYNLVAHFTSENYNITVRANPTNGGMVYGSDYNVPHGEERTVTAVPFANYNFVCWTNEDGQWLSTDSLYTFPVERSMILVANFTLKSLAIIATPSPPEGGTCTGGGNYIIYGTEITLTATPNEIYRFVEWREDTVPVSTNSVYKFTVTRSRDLTAIFELKTFDVYLSVNPQTGGTVEGGGNHIPFGTVITVRAKANLNYEFDRWTTESITGATVSNDAVFTFNVTSSQILFAHFKPKTYSLTVWANPPTGGTVEGNDTNIPYEETRTVSATVSDNYHFIGWTEEGIPGILSTELDYTFLVTRSRELTANFALNIFNITVEAYPSQGGSVDGGGLIVFGENASV
ncbi:MAG: InlB B-repeat-containing protein, partial [Peptococcaceae bacterium]|nr:InlB B-repeat-containing protein [Peptococcaceae bacterium]